MDSSTASAQSAIAEHEDWQQALAMVLDETRAQRTSPVDLALLFASAAYGDDLAALVRRARAETGATVLIGCSGQGIIGPSREVEGPPSVSLLTLSLPGAGLEAGWLGQRELEARQTPADWHAATGVEPDSANGWLVFADPFHIHVDSLVNGLQAAYPSAPQIGGLASGAPRERRTFVFLNDRVYEEGAVAMALCGPYTVRTVVSQGAEPISQPWTITAARGHVVQTIGHRPALEVLGEAIHSLPAEQQRRARGNLLVGLAMDEYKDTFGRGDFLIRNLMQVDRQSGAIAIGAHPRVGQTIQFQLRDAQAADEELAMLLERAGEQLGERRPLAALLCSCNGRGAGLFGRPNHDVEAVQQRLALQPIAGFFCNGEIGPVGPRNFVHGYTASIGLIVPAE